MAAGAEDRIRWAVLLLGGTTLAVMIAAAIRWPRLLPWGLGCLLATYATSLVSRPALDLDVPIFAAAILVVGELMGAAGGGRSSETRPSQFRGGVELLLSAVLASVVADIILVAAALRPRGSLILEAIGGIAAVGAFAMLARLAASPVHGARPGER
jgi:hypothetical protein